jgi:acyl carrier protein
MEASEREIRQFIVDNFLFGQEDVAINDRDSLLQLGIIDSTGVLELVAFLEQRFGIKVDDEELVPANLDSIHDLVRFIDAKTRSTLT